MSSTITTQAAQVVALAGSGAPMDEVNAAFRDLTVTERNEVRRTIDARLSDAIGAMDLNAATTWNTVRNGLDGSKVPAAATIDHAALVATATAHLAAAMAVVAAYAADNGLDVDTIDTSAVTVDATRAADLAHKAGLRTPRGTYTGPRRDVAAHIESAFADVPSGTFLTVAAIAGHSSDTYGDDHPSSGAVWARLTADTFDAEAYGIVVVTRSDDDPSSRNGARKI